ncbi:MAG: non-ribosomal peptide synthase/polyketide synthase [Bacteroidetes bacterium]|nr:non-ribosomal peptide synthase/polyketide synthase [Bacteroidota bacterium]
MISKQNLKDLYPLSLMQEGMLFHALLETQSTAYFEQTSYLIKGNLDIEIFKYSLNELFKRHDVLRTVIVHKKVARPLQVVLKELEAAFYFEDLRQQSPEEQKKAISEFCEKDVVKGFNLSEDVLMRLAVLQTADDAWRVVWSHHHILMDGWCVGILLQEFMELYRAKKAGRAARLSKPIPYSTYIKWLEKQDKKSASEYWKEYVAGYEGQTVLPELSKTSKSAYQRAQVSLKFDTETTAKLEGLAKKNGVTLNTLLQACWAILLQKYNSSDDVVFGAVVSGRPTEIDGVESMVGLFINTLVVRVACGEDETLSQLLKKMQQQAGASDAHAYFPLAEVQSFTTQRQNLINHILVFENYPLQQELQQISDPESGYTIGDVELFEQTNYNLTVMIMPGKEIAVHFDYNAAVFSTVVMDQLKTHFFAVVTQALANTDVSVAAISIISEKEKQQILQDFNATTVTYPKQSVLELFEEQVLKTPGKVAVVFDDKSLSYQQVDKLSDKLASYLLNNYKIQPEEIIGVMPERSEQVLVCLLGILKAGGVYLPIDPNYPQERIEHMLEDSRVKVLLSEEKFKAQLSFYKGKIVEITSLANYPDNEEKPAPFQLPRADQLAYIIYTSGSTGKPKGVACTHRCLYNLMEWQLRESGIGGGLTSIQYASLSFDVSVQEMLYNVISGGTMHVIDNDMRQDMNRLALLLDEKQIELLTLPFSALNLLFSVNKDLHKIKSLKHIITSGEQLQLSAGIKEFLLKRPDVYLHNQYGPSETHVVTSYSLCGKDNLSETLPPIGKPIANTTAYILDKAGNPVPVGVAGELYLGGVQVARGYLNRQDLTAEKFLPNPFTPGEVFYKTGDLAKWLPDGNIMFLGRIDGQVKIRGFRIELGEIESNLLNHPEIIEAAVIVKEIHSGVKELAAYIVAQKELSLNEIRKYLGKSLPEYMIPAYFSSLEKLPLSPNGKVDKRALPEPEGGLATGTEYVEPSTETEKQLALIWQELLGVEKIGLKDNFFDLGGHSLKATMLVSRIHKALDKEVPLREVFALPTIGQLSAFIENSGTQKFSSIQPAEKKEFYPLSSAQKRMFVLNSFEGVGTSYNISGVFKLVGEIDINQFETAVKETINNHEILRTSFKLIENEAVQIIHQELDFRVVKINCSEIELPEILDNFIQPFDLSQAPLIRIALINLEQEEYVLATDIHHIISDGVSIQLLLEEICQRYEGVFSASKVLEYKDFSSWQFDNLSNEGFSEHKKYWKNKFSEDVNRADLPADFERPASQSFEGDLLKISLKQDDAALIKNLTERNGITPYMFFLSVFYAFIHRYTRQNDICIGTPVSGRTHKDLQNIQGMFVNTLPLRNQVNPAGAFEELLSNTKNEVLDTLKYQDYPFEELLLQLQLEKDTSRNPLFDYMFSFLEDVTADFSTKDFKVKHLESTDHKTSMFDLSLEVLKTGENYTLCWEFCTRIFKKQTVENFAAHYLNLLKVFLQDEKLKISEAGILSECEIKHQLNILSGGATKPFDLTWLDLFNNVVESYPDKTALIRNNNEISYRELNEKANALAHKLIEGGVGAEQVVALRMKSSPEFIYSVIGILKAGAAYLPIDIEYPADRALYMLDNSGAKVLITSPDFASDISFSGSSLEANAELFNGKKENPEARCTADNMAYILFTSGSTGKPKGVITEHRGIANYVDVLPKLLGLTSEDTFVQHASVSFDVSVDEIFCSLGIGATLILPNDRKNLDELIDIVESGKLTFYEGTPLILSYINENAITKGNLKKVWVGGDTLKLSDCKKLLPEIEIINGYGPTEASITASWYTLNGDEKEIPIGKPIPNYRLFVVDNNLNLMPEGAIGELCIGGIGLAREYLNSPELTKEKFTFLKQTDERIYRTGDLVKWLPDGNLAFLGRIDNQVKIRGQRIELGEIENKLEAIENISQVAVIDKTNAEGSKYLVAYYVSEKEISSEIIRKNLTASLPDYMVPAHFVRLEKLPKTANDKLDRKALPEPFSVIKRKEYKAPSTELEKAACEAFKTVLKASLIGVEDNFFDCGGDSLKAMILSSVINKALGIKLGIEVIFKNPTPGEIAAIAATLGKSDYKEISQVPEQEYYQLSPSQTRLWLLDKIHGNSVDYNMADLFTFNEAVKPHILEKAFDTVVQRHEAIRTNFVEIEGQPKQKINQALSFKLNMLDFSNEVNSKAKTELLYKNECDFVFDLSKDLLLRATLVKEKENTWHLIFNIHHIVSDGWSMNIFKNELVALYRAFESEQENPLAPLRIQYKDYASWQQEQIVGSNLHALKNYWHKVLEGELPVMELPYDFSYAHAKKGSGSRYSFVLDNELKNKLNKLALSSNSSLFMVLLSGFNILLQRLSNTQDIIIGTPVAGRGHEDLKRLIGFFLNTVVLRNQVSAELNIEEYLKAVKENTLQALENQDYPFEQLVDDLKIPRDINRFPITSVFFNMLNLDGENHGDLAESKSSFEHHNNKVKFDLNVYASEYNNGLQLTLEYKNELFLPQTIEAFSEKFKQILEQLAEDSSVAVKDISTHITKNTPLPYQEVEWYKDELTVPEVLQNCFKKYASNVAFKTAATEFKYSDLNEISNQLARHLSKFGTKQRVAICLEHNEFLAVAITGVLKSGNAYVPIDPAYPVSRLKFIVEESQPVAIITDKANKSLANELLNKNSICLDESEAAYLLESAEDFIVKVNAEDEAYVLYTSGSTGQPKGVSQTHKGILHFASIYAAAIGITAEDKLSGFSSVCFDSFNHELFPALFSGASYLPLSLKSGITINELSDWTNENKITVWQSVPTVFRQFADEVTEKNIVLSGIRILKMTGEASTREDFEKFKKITNALATFVVSYGSTENSLTTINLFTHNSAVTKAALPAGNAVNNTDIIILNSSGKTADALEAGEVILHSPGLTKGYLNIVENDKIFVTIENKKYYKSGDIGRLNLSGQLEILGRKDGQVKIRGMRIELSEIEAGLLAYPEVKLAAATISENNDGLKRLVAYVISSKSLDSTELRNHLSKHLPEHMIPAVFVQLEKFPMTPSGKVDRKALPAPDETALSSSTVYVAPRNTTEEKLAQMWQQLLDVKQVGVTDNFFELGGHSLKASSFVARVNKEFQRNLPLKQIFITPTIEGVAAYIEKSSKSALNTLISVGGAGKYPVSSAQMRLFLLNQFDPESTGYNMPNVMEVHGRIDRQKVEAIFQMLISRHESLRTSFEMSGTELLQKVGEEVSFNLEKIETSVEDAEKAISRFIRPFDLLQAPLLRAGLVSITEDHFLLLFDMHHIISDGTSMQLITTDFIKLYRGEALEPLAVQYKDYAVWQKESYKNERLLKEEKYWLDKFEDLPEVLELPYDLPRPREQSFRGDRAEAVIDKELLNKFKNLLQQNEVTLYMGLLAVYNILLAKYSGQEDLIVGSPVAGRNHPGLEPVLGMFVNTLAIRNQPAKNKTFNQLIAEVKENALDAFENQEYPFEQLVDKLKIEKNLGRNPLFDVTLVLQNMDTADQNIEGISFKPYDLRNYTSKFDLTLSALEESEGLLLNMEYSTDLFKHSTIERMLRHFEQIIAEVVTDSNKTIAAINLLTYAETKKVTEEFSCIRAPYPKEKTIVELFEEQVLKTPDLFAISLDGNKLSYAELNRRANQIAAQLLKKGVKMDELVAIITSRSVETIIGMLGVLKAGAGYVPVDGDYPAERIQFILHDCNARALLVNGQLPSVSFEGAIIDLSSESIYDTDYPNPSTISGPRDLAYAIYTSGTTGQPKGVLVENQAVVRLVKNTNYISIKEGDKLLQTGSISFDASTFEIWGALLNGAELHLCSLDDMLDPKKLKSIINENKIDILWLTTSFFHQLADAHIETFSGLNYLGFGGDRCLTHLVNKVRDAYPGMQLVHFYGPTENTTFSTAHNIVETYQGAVPIGIPIANSEVYILDDERKAVPIGVRGYLYVGGDGLSRGYLNRHELTSEKFVTHPFKDGKKLYFTGDIARWLEDGTIEFLGRDDHQVKIRGFRIELGEIEQCLMECSYVKQASVIDWNPENNNKQLVAYLVMRGEANFDQVKKYLNDKLPEYMIPAYFMAVEKLPLTRNGKLDRRALPEPVMEETGKVKFIVPATEIQLKVASAWKELLKIDRVCIKDNFFDKGGHSLKAAQLVSLIRAQMGVEISLREIFRNPTLEGIANFIEKAEEVNNESIPTYPESPFYPVSAAQRRMFVINQFEDNKGTAYNIPFALRVKGIIDKTKLEQVLNQLIQRHEILRTTFELRDGEPVQLVQENLLLKPEYLNASEKEIEQTIYAFVRPFNLSEAQLVRVSLVNIGDEDNLLLFDMHHIISDGVSVEIMVKEFVSLYSNEALEPLKIQYKDFANWQFEQFNNGAIQKQQQYWVEQFKDDVPLLDLPTDFARSAIQNFSGDNAGVLLDSGTSEEIRAFCKNKGVTPYMFFLSIYYVLLHRYTNQNDIVVGTAVAGRSHADLHSLIGMFVNTLALRNHPNSTSVFEDFLISVKENTLKALDNQDYPFEDLVEQIELKRDISRNPLFDVFFNYQVKQEEQFLVDGWEISVPEFENKIAKFDLKLDVQEQENNFEIEFSFATELFKKDTINQLLRHFTNLLSASLADPKKALNKLEMLSEQEKETLLYSFNDTKAAFPRKMLQEIFEEQVLKRGNDTAIIWDGGSMSYDELNKKSNKLAHHLRINCGVEREEIVGLLVDRSEWMLVAILGVLKAGGTYLPIDPDYPEDRIGYMLEDSGCKIIVTRSDLKDLIKNEIQIVLADAEEIKDQPEQNLPLVNQPDDRCYIIYTSGSTGRPKGVQISHHNVVRLLFNDRNLFDFNANDTWSLFHSYCFDFSVWEMYGALLYGGKLLIVPKETAQNPPEFVELAARHKVTVLNQTPGAFYNFIRSEQERGEKDPHLRYIIFGGEALHPSRLKGWHQKYPEVKLVNMYGITETTVHVTYKEIGEKEIAAGISNIGIPIPTLSCYIMDMHQNLQPVGVSGELCVGGEGLSKGYLNREELTAEKFIPHPYIKGEKLYRSGDLAKWLDNGELEYLGRIDHQVKIRGFRIELGEIEKAIDNHPAIKQAVVIDREDEKGEKYLCAYIVEKDGSTVTTSQMRDHLRSPLPDYMVPSFFIKLDEIPLTSNGKVARKELPLPGGVVDTGAEYIAPRNKTEQQLEQIWREILKVKKISVKDNFFDLGGHSLKATQVLARIREQLNAGVTFRDLFTYTTIEDLASVIQNKGVVKGIPGIISLPEQEYYSASFAQQRLWLMNKIEGAASAFNMPMAYVLDGELNISAFKKAFDTLIQRHESLRTTFIAVNGVPKQKIHKQLNFAIKEEDLSANLNKNELVKAYAENEVKTAFDLEKGPLLRASLIKMEAEKFIFLFTMHHIISDGWSMGVLTKELFTLYDAYCSKKENPLQDLKVHYKEYAAWQETLMEAGNIEIYRNYWKQKLNNNLPVLEVNIDYSRPAVKTFNGAFHRFVFSNELTEAIKKSAKDSNVSTFVMVQSIFKVMLYKQTAEEDIIIGTPVAGRVHKDLENQIGFFINTLPLRNKISWTDTLKEVVERVGKTTIEAYENQLYPFDRMVEDLKVKRDASRSPIFDIGITWQDYEDLQKDQVNSITISSLETELKFAKYDLWLYGFETEDGIDFSFEFNTDLYKKSTVENLSEQLIKIANEFASGLNKQISDIELEEKTANVANENTSEASFDFNF